MFTRDDKTVKEFISEFIVSLMWSEHDDDGDKFDEMDVSDMSAETMQAIENRCIGFLNYPGVWEYFTETPDGYGLDMLAHDLALTPNGHGAGFWDRGLGDIGERLTAISDTFGEFHLYIGDDGRIYHV